MDCPAMVPTWLVAFPVPNPPPGRARNNSMSLVQVCAILTVTMTFQPVKEVGRPEAVIVEVIPDERLSGIANAGETDAEYPAFVFANKLKGPPAHVSEEDEAAETVGS